MVDADGVDDAVAAFLLYSAETADPFPSVSVSANPLDLVRAVEGGREEVLRSS